MLHGSRVLKAAHQFAREAVDGQLVGFGGCCLLDGSGCAFALDAHLHGAVVARQLQVVTALFAGIHTGFVDVIAQVLAVVPTVEAQVAAAHIVLGILHACIHVATDIVVGLQRDGVGGQLNLGPDGCIVGALRDIVGLAHFQQDGAVDGLAG